MKRGPNPATLSLPGTGNHPLFEFSNNLNHRLNQYRGGEAYVGSLGKSEDVYLWRHPNQNQHLINSSAATAPVGTGFGGNFTIRNHDGAAFPSKMTVTGLAVFIDENPSNTATMIEWFSDSGFTTSLSGGPKTIAAGVRGLVPIVMNDPTKWQTLTAGELYVRIFKPATGQSTQGSLLIYYCPLMGS